MSSDDEIRTTSEDNNHRFSLCHKAWEYLKSFVVSNDQVKDSNNNNDNNNNNEPVPVVINNNKSNTNVGKLSSNRIDIQRTKNQTKVAITDVRKRKSAFKPVSANNYMPIGDLINHKNKHDIARQEVMRLVNEKSTRKYGKSLNLKKQSYHHQQNLRKTGRNRSQFFNFGNITTFADINNSRINDSYVNFYNNNHSYNHSALNFNNSFANNKNSTTTTASTINNRNYMASNRTMNNISQLIKVPNTTINNTSVYPNNSSTSFLFPNASVLSSGILNTTNPIALNGANKKLLLNSRSVSSKDDDLRIIKIKKIAKRNNHISDIANNYLKNFQYKSYQDILRSKRELQRQVEEKREKGLSESKIKDLSDEQYSKVKQYWNYRGGSNAIVCTINNIDIRITDLQTLQNGQWLNDNVIDSYLSMIVERSKSSQDRLPKIFIFTTHFFTTLQTKGYNGVRRWAMRKKINVLELDYVFVPINIMNSHWTLGIINNREKKFQYYDSLPGSHNGDAIMENLAHYMSSERKRLVGNTDLKFENEYKFENCNSGPKQKNGFDCGVFACMEIEYLSRESPLTFTQNDMLIFRKKMAYELITKKLL